MLSGAAKVFVTQSYFFITPRVSVKTARGEESVSWSVIGSILSVGGIIRDDSFIFWSTNASEASLFRRVSILFMALLKFLSRFKDHASCSAFT